MLDKILFISFSTILLNLLFGNSQNYEAKEFQLFKEEHRKTYSS